MYNAGNRKDIRRGEKDAKLADQQRKEIVTQIMQTMPGRRWMLEKLEECHVFRTSFNRDSSTMAFMEGQRDIGLKLLNDIMASCPDEYLLMMRESNERRSASERAREQDSNGRDKGPDPVDPIDDIYTEPGDDDGDETTRDDAN
jgi:hypothetical protein